MYQAIGVVNRIFGDADAAPHVIGYAEFAFPKVGVDCFILIETKHTNGNAANLEMSFCYEFFFGCIDFNHFSFLRFSVEMCDGAGKHPRVETFQ